MSKSPEAFNYKAGFLFSNIMLIADSPEVQENVNKMIEQLSQGDTTDDPELFSEKFIHLEGIDWYIALPDSLVRDIMLSS